ncbi:hypothetical protein [Blastopirellula marina]|nr:hypothetical protein [Blastopirellula marina]
MAAIDEHPAVDVPEQANFTIAMLVTTHAVVYFFAISKFPFVLWGQVAILGFWTLAGRGSIWGRLALAIILTNGIVLTHPEVMGGSILYSLNCTLLFSAIFSGIAVLIISHMKDCRIAPVRFRLWEIVVGTAALGGSFYWNAYGLDWRTALDWHREEIRFFFVATILLGFATAVITAPTLLRRGVAYWIVTACGYAMLIVVPLADDVACRSFAIKMIPSDERVIGYVINLAVILVTVSLYERIIAFGREPILATLEENAIPEQTTP